MWLLSWWLKCFIMGYMAESWSFPTTFYVWKLCESGVDLQILFYDPSKSQSLWLNKLHFSFKQHISVCALWRVFHPYFRNAAQFPSLKIFKRYYQTVLPFKLLLVNRWQKHHKKTILHTFFSGNSLPNFNKLYPLCSLWHKKTLCTDWTKGSFSVQLSSLLSGEEYTQDPFRWDFVGKNVAFMAVEGFIYFTLNLLIQYRFFLDHW